MARSTQTAADAYKARQKSIRNRMALLQRRLEKHESEQARSPKNWGWAGDLARIDELLAQALGEED